MNKQSAEIQIPHLKLDLSQEKKFIDRFTLWQESVRPLFHTFPIGDTQSSRIVHSSEMFQLDNIVVAKTGFGEQFFVRDKKWCRQYDESDHILIQYYQQGYCETNNGSRSFLMNQDSIGILDLNETLFSKTSVSKVLSVVIPREVLENKLGDCSLIENSPLSVDGFKGKLLLTAMQTLWQQLLHGGLSSGLELKEDFMDLLGGLFGKSNRSEDKHILLKEANIVEGISFRVVSEYIKRNLADPKLNVEHLCKRFFCSRAKLYRLFHSVGGVSQYIQFLRLCECYKELSRVNENTSILSIAIKWGFSNHSHFTRSFKKVFGLSPSSIVELAKENLLLEPSQNPASPESAAHQIQKWFVEI